MTITIIGGNGFLGRRLRARLAEEGSSADVLVVARRPLEADVRHAVADVRDVDALTAAVPRGAVVVNLAAEHRDDVAPERYGEVNVDGARNVCDAARRRGVRTIVFTSSVAVYDAAADTSESAPCQPEGHYGASKLAAEGVYRQWQAESADERTLVIVRPAPIFGQGGAGNVATLMDRIASPRFVLVGNGRNLKSLAYVDNVAAFLAFCLGLRQGVHIYNYVDKPDLTTAALVALVRRELDLPAGDPLRIPYPVALAAAALLDAVARSTGREFAVTAARVRRFCAATVYETSVRSTGFCAPVPLAEALRRTARAMVGRPG
ncbi:MAG: NAD-dependent epimerase/dehydratase family protein [Gammaproteobacteria bacterium]|nr:NAD-dependent epimerase/dehydratase family protein [Gammaproteobacteria bacterium]